MTRKLFHNNSRLVEFQAQIIKTKIIEDVPAICLDMTAFYPTSGGQPFDTGMINDTRVTNVWEEESDIWHQVEAMPIENKITGVVDWNRRYDHMQQHTGQHLLSAVFFDEMNANTIGFHIGRKNCTIDLDIVKVTENDIDIIESIRPLAKVMI
jgi:alanyl-tRNA synthetase